MSSIAICVVCDYRDRRNALVEAHPEATVRGIAAGLHVTVDLPASDDEDAIREQAPTAASGSRR